MTYSSSKKYQDRYEKNFSIHHLFSYELDDNPCRHRGNTWIYILPMTQLFGLSLGDGSDLLGKNCLGYSNWYTSATNHLVFSLSLDFAIKVRKITSHTMLASTSFATSAFIYLFLSHACPPFFCLMGTLPDITFKLCSMTSQSTPIMYVGF